MASMRPRHMCLGKQPHDRAERDPDIASMRPRHMCLGKLRMPLFGCGNMRRFNEAEAHVPRKTRSHRPPHPARCRFNEAEAHVPRKTPTETAHPRTPTSASMRPRHMCLGKQATPSRFTKVTTSFNEAEAHVPRKTNAGIGLNPMSLRFNEAEAHVPRKTWRSKVFRCWTKKLQ